VAGVDLIRRISGKQADIYSIPLVINKSTGVKFGKSEEGAIWLDSNKTSVYKFYQFWLNADDEGVIDYLKIYTMLGKEEIELIERKRDTNPSARDAQKALAREVTILVHGVERYNSVKRVTDVLFGNADFKTLDENDINGLSLEIPCSNINKTISEIFTETGITKSRGEAKRLIIAGAVAVNNKKINDDIIVKSCCLIRKGKNNFVLVR
jgi:tyrosyl-tRNA synthetase